MLDIIAAQVHYYGVFNINERGENMSNPTDNVVRYQDCVLCGDQISSERQIHNVGTDVCGKCAEECKPCTAP